MKVALDTNCFIDAVNRKSHAYETMQTILKASYSGEVTLLASLHSLYELERKPDGALALAKSIPLLPHFPIGTWEEQVETWNQAAGTWEDAKRNEEIRKDLKKLANAKAGIRDLGVYIDALFGHADVLVTSDGDLVKEGPSKQIAAKYGLKAITPAEFVSELSSRSKQ